MATPSTPLLASPVSGVGEHKHCEVCGKAIALDGRLCSAECETRFQAAVKQRKRSVYIFVGAIALILLFNLYGGRLFGA